MNMVKSKVIEVGKMAYFEGYPILILFNSFAPVELKDVSIIHEFITPISLEMLKVGSSIMFNEKKYTVEAIGDLANQNFHSLGHISLYFDLEKGASLLAGSVLLSPKQVPQVNVGDIIQFIK